MELFKVVLVPFRNITHVLRNNAPVIKKVGIPLLVIILLFTLALSVYTNIALSREIAELKKKLVAVSSDVDSFRVNNDKMVTELKNLDDFKLKVLTDLTVSKLKIDQYSKAVFNAQDSAKGFARVDSTTGMFFIILDNVEQNSNGYKLYFRVGNPQNCIYSGFNIKLRWGKKYNNEDKTMTYDEWDKSLKSNTYTFKNLLVPGQWTNFEVDISTENSDELQYIEVKIQAEQISMQKTSDSSK